MLGEPRADEQEDEEGHSLRGGTEDPPRSSATKRRKAQIFKSPIKKVICWPTCWFVYMSKSVDIDPRCESVTCLCEDSRFNCVADNLFS